MKAIIAREGLLSLIPENATEQFALKMWFQNFKNGDTSSSIEACIGSIFVSDEEENKRL